MGLNDLSNTVWRMIAKADPFPPRNPVTLPHIQRQPGLQDSDRLMERNGGRMR